ncbi:MAG: chemotaxis response regulator CheB [Alteromonadaceae bacterium]|jgi:chemotaxis response regulator CheB
MTVINNIFIVNDSPVLTAVMKAIVETEAEVKVVGCALNGKQALKQITSEVDAVLMDIHMPGMNGAEVTLYLMNKFRKLRILITTADVSNNQTWIFQALKAGAIDYVQTPKLKVLPGTLVTAIQLKLAGKMLLHKLNVLAKVDIHNSIAKQHNQQLQKVNKNSLKAINNNLHHHWFCIGASTGGPTTLATLLKSIVKPLSGSIIICQHNDLGFTDGLARWLQDETGFICHEVTQRLRPKPGHVYIAQGGADLQATLGSYIRPQKIDTSRHYHPNIDLFLESVVALKSVTVTAAILTGMGNDGAQGLAMVQESGGTVYVQDQQSAIIDSMPNAAKAAVGLQTTHTPQRIGQLVSNSLGRIA